MKLNKEQKQAVKALERAFAKCVSTDVYFHNHYGKLIAYDGNIVSHVNDIETEISCRDGYVLKIEHRLDSWADDFHYVHLKHGKW